ncbi:MAG: hypothetical protein LBU25_08985 [Treponema sp.]|jgi:hypothetical protein|nr:hypothetical protein [Treponema sp.]
MRYTQWRGILFFFMGFMVPEVGAKEDDALLKQQPPPMVKTDTGANGGDISALVGLTVEELIFRFGFPQSVYAVRGVETWQDDVVFSYEAGNFYVYKDRVWQIEVKTAYGIHIGDNLASISWILGEGTQMYSNYFLIPLRGHPWPLMLRLNFTGAGLISAIFIYRPDF